MRHFRSYLSVARKFAEYYPSAPTLILPVLESSHTPYNSTAINLILDCPFLSWTIRGYARLMAVLQGLHRQSDRYPIIEGDRRVAHDAQAWAYLFTITVEKRINSVVRLMTSPKTVFACSPAELLQTICELAFGDKCAGGKIELDSLARAYEFPSLFEERQAQRKSLSSEIVG